MAKSVKKDAVLKLYYEEKNPKTGAVQQKAKNVSAIRLEASDEQLLQMADAIATVMAREVVQVAKQETYYLAK